jgi:hypothetical protein
LPDIVGRQDTLHGHFLKWILRNRLKLPDKIWQNNAVAFIVWLLMTWLSALHIPVFLT